MVLALIASCIENSSSIALFISQKPFIANLFRIFIAHSGSLETSQLLKLFVGDKPGVQVCRHARLRTLYSVFRDWPSEICCGFIKTSRVQQVSIWEDVHRVHDVCRNLLTPTYVADYWYSTTWMCLGINNEWRHLIALQEHKKIAC